MTPEGFVGEALPKRKKTEQTLVQEKSKTKEQKLEIEKVASNKKTEINNVKVESRQNRVEVTNETLEGKEKLSEQYIGKNEVTNFKKIFNLKTEKDFVTKVLEIQRENNLKVDGVIGVGTLEVIYKKYYTKMDKLPKEILDRKKFVDFMSLYPEKKAKQVPLTGLENPYSKKYFYGESKAENILGTNLNSELVSLVGKEIPETSNYNGGNSIELKRLSNGKYSLAMYVSGKISVLTYASPGSSGHRTPAYPNGNKIDFLTPYYVSGSYPKRASGVNGGAVMPMAYEIDASIGIYGHVGMTTGAGASKGCIRAPGFYQQAIFENLKKYGNQNFKFRTVGKIY